VILKAIKGLIFLIDVTELRDLRSSLQHQTELFENMTNSLVTHAAHAETIIMRLQNEFIRALTVITIVSSFHRHF